MDTDKARSLPDNLKTLAQQLWDEKFPEDAPKKVDETIPDFGAIHDRDAVSASEYRRKIGNLERDRLLAKWSPETPRGTWANHHMYQLTVTFKLMNSLRADYTPFDPAELPKFRDQTDDYYREVEMISEMQLTDSHFRNLEEFIEYRVRRMAQRIWGKTGRAAILYNHELRPM